LLGIKLPKGILVVDATSAEPNLPGEIAIPLDEDHLSICKPASRDAQIYRSLLRWVDECAPVPRAQGTQAVDRLSAARFDCFLSHNSSDKPRVRALADRRLRVWLDEEQLRPGLPWQPLLEAGIRDSAAVAVCIAADGLGPWQDTEMQAALQLAARNPAQPVMAVLLPGAPDWPALPAFLTVRGWVDLRVGMADGLDRLVWGITGRRAESPAPPPPPADPQPAPAGPPPVREPGQPGPAAPGSPYPRAAAVWRQKLEYLLEQEAVTSNAAQRFELSKQIAECRAKLRELGVEP
jgi:hypothetical protein